MAKKQNNGSISYDRLAGILSLISIFVSGIIWFISFLIKALGGSFNGGILNFIASLLMTIAVIMISWKALKRSHLTGNKTVWIVIYWVIVVLCLAGLIGVSFI